MRKLDGRFCGLTRLFEDDFPDAAESELPEWLDVATRERPGVAVGDWIGEPEENARGLDWEDPAHWEPLNNEGFWEEEHLENEGVGGELLGGQGGADGMRLLGEQEACGM